MLSGILRVKDIIECSIGAGGDNEKMIKEKLTTTNIHECISSMKSIAGKMEFEENQNRCYEKFYNTLTKNQKESALLHKKFHEELSVRYQYVDYEKSKKLRESAIKKFMEPSPFGKQTTQEEAEKMADKMIERERNIFGILNNIYHEIAQKLHQIEKNDKKSNNG